MIFFDRVTVHYAEGGPPPLRDVTLRIEEGELCLVAGRTGAGKSTLLRAINGLVPHFTGGTLHGAITTAVAIVLAGPAVLAALRRAVRRAAFGAPVTFATACDPPAPRADGDDVTTPGVPLSSSRQDGDVVTGHALGSAADQAEFGGGGDGRGA